jgi:hypothetical protein
MNKSIVFLFILFFSSCHNKYTPEEITKAYCDCTSLLASNKEACVKEWAAYYKGRLQTKEELKQVNYNMIECNGFEGENDFDLISL